LSAIWSGSEAIKTFIETGRDHDSRSHSGQTAIERPPQRRVLEQPGELQLALTRSTSANEKLFGQPRSFFLEQFRRDCSTNPSQSASPATAPFRGHRPLSLY
jgi:hypothetical protein